MERSPATMHHVLGVGSETVAAEVTVGEKSVQRPDGGQGKERNGLGGRTWT